MDRTAAAASDPCELRPLIEKLGHPLEEIRVRALDSVVQKLKYGLLEDADLVQERDLLGALLRWFSFPNCRKQEECLELLVRLTKHDSAVRLLGSLGAAGRLALLRAELPARLHALVDAVVERLLLLPSDVDAASPGSSSGGCDDIALCRDSGDSSTDGGWDLSPGCLEQGDSANPSSQPNLRLRGLDLHGDMTRQPLQQKARQQRHEQHNTSPILQQQRPRQSTAAGSWGGVAAGSSGGGRATANTSTEVLTPASTDDADASASASEPAADLLKLSGSSVTYFPWLQLTATDQHVLQSTNDSLASGNRALIINACEFFIDVILYDFPVEVFLQQPDIVKSLLRLIADPPGRDGSLVTAALGALLRLTEALKARVRSHGDACLKQKSSSDATGNGSLTSSSFSAEDGSVSSSVSRPSLVGSSEMGSDEGNPVAAARTGNWQRDSSSRHGCRQGRADAPLHHSSVMMSDGASSGAVPALRPGAAAATTTRSAAAATIAAAVSCEIGQHSVQLSVPEYCLTSSRELLHAVLGCSSFRVAVRTARVLLSLYELLTAADDGTVVARIGSDEQSLRDQLGSIVCHRIAAAALYWHREHSIVTAAAAGGAAMTADQRHHLFVVLSCLSLKYLEAFFAPGKAAQEMPPKVKELLGVLAFEEALLRSFPDARCIVAAYLPMVDEGRTHALYEGVQVLASSMKKTCSFLLEIVDASQPSEERVAELVNLAEQSLFSLPYHQDTEIVSAYGHFYASLFDRPHLYDGTMRYATVVMLKFLSHPLIDVRCLAYKTALKIIKACLALENAGTMATKRVWFVANQDVLKEVIYFGLDDTLAEVRKYAADIICHVLQSKSLLTEGLWDTVLSTVAPLLPVLQAYSSHDTLLGRCILGLITSECLKGALSKLQRLKGILRGLFLKDDIIRRSLAKVLPSVVDRAADDALMDVSAGVLVQSDSSVTADDYGDTDASPAATSSFDESFTKLYAIIESRTVDRSLRASAAEQLAVLLRDTVLHKSFIRRGGLEFVRANIKCAARPTTETSVQPHGLDLLPACTRMLCRLLQSDAALRTTLGNDKQFLEDLLRCIVRHGDRDEGRLGAAVTQALAFVLFENVSQLSASGRYCLPKIVCQRYKLPMHVGFCNESSSHMCKVPPPSDPLRGPQPLDALKFCWSSAIYGGTSELLLAIDSDAYCVPRSPGFLVAEQRVAAIRASCPLYVVKCSLDSVANASTHRTVQSALLMLSACSLAARLGGAGEAFAGVSWRTTFARFFSSLPRVPADEELLADILSFLLQYVTLNIRDGRADDPDVCARDGRLSSLSDTALQELVDACSSRACALMTCIVLPPLNGPTPCSRRSLQNDLLEILCCHGVRAFSESSTPTSMGGTDGGFDESSSLLQTDDGSSDVHSGSATLRGNIVRLLLQKLTLADAANFYNLAALESIITALMHMTARQGWSDGAADVDGRTLCYQLLDSLFEVLSAFNVDKQGLATSYMGKGVIRSAALCLLNVVRELGAISPSEDWLDGLLLWRQSAGRSPADSPHTASGDVIDHLSWMVPLWSYRSCAEVRAAAFAAAAEIVRSFAASGGTTSTSVMWRAAMSSVCDAGECTLVRHQAASVLCCIVAQISEKADKKKPPLRQDERDIICSVRDEALVQHLGGFLQNYLNDVAVADLVQLVVRCSGSSSRQPSVVARFASDALADALETAFVGDACRLLASLRRVAPDVVCSAVSQLDLHALLSRLALTLTHLPLASRGVAHSADSADGGVGQSTITAEASLRVRRTIACVVHTLTLLRLCSADGGSDVLRRNMLAGETAALDEIVVLLTWRSAAAAPEGGREIPTYRQLDVSPVRTAACSMLSSLLAVDDLGGTVLLRLLPLLLRTWPDFIDAIHGLLSSAQPARRRVAMELLLLVVSLEERLLFEASSADVDGAPHPLPSGHQQQQQQQACSRLSAALDSPSATGEDTASGWRLCKRLLAIYDALPVSRYGCGEALEHRTLAALLFAGVIAASRSAKSCAFKMGLVETAVAHARGLIKEVESLPAPMKANRLVALSLVNEALLTLGILCAFLLGGGRGSSHAEASEAVLRSADVGGLVQALWPWCSNLGGSGGSTAAVDARLTLALLGSIKRLAGAQHMEAASGGHQHRQQQQHYIARTASPEGGSGCSCCCSTHSAVAQLLVRITSAEWSRMHPDVIVLREAMAAMSILALQPPLISFVSKSNLAAGFLAVNPREAGKNKKQHQIATLWLRFFLNLSFSAEGQQVILKHKESLSILLELGCSKDAVLQETSLIILHNLSNTGFGGQRLLASEEFCAMLHNAMLNSEDSALAVLLETVSALLKDSAKSKVLLKNGGLSQSLCEVASRLHGTITSTHADKDKPNNSEARLQVAHAKRLLSVATRLQECLR